MQVRELWVTGRMEGEKASRLGEWWTWQNTRENGFDARDDDLYTG